MGRKGSEVICMTSRALPPSRSPFIASSLSLFGPAVQPLPPSRTSRHYCHFPLTVAVNPGILSRVGTLGKKYEVTRWMIARHGTSGKCEI